MTPVDLKMTNFKAYVDRTKAVKYKTSMKTCLLCYKTSYEVLFSPPMINARML